MKRNVFKVILFLGIGVGLAAVLQYVFVPKWEYQYTSTTLETYRMAGFYNEPEESLQVLMLGPSHIFCGCSPNELYEDYGITSYNLGSPRQPIEATYFMLKEAFKTQSPEVIVFDVGELFLDTYTEADHRHILDQMPFSIDKLAYVKELIAKDDKNSFATLLFPLLRYHDRWKKLYENDFMELVRNKHYFMKGYFCDAKILPGYVMPEQANADVAYVNSIKNGRRETYAKECFEEAIEVEYYQTQIGTENIKWLIKIKELCNEENAELLLVKVPSMGNVFLHPSVWTEQRSWCVKELCRQYGILFFDMLYDCESDIDWTTDTNDSGNHLNILGAIKVSDVLGQYLTTNYNLEENYNKLWDQDLAKYQKLREYALLAAKTDFVDYLDALSANLQGKTIFIAVEDDAIGGMGEILKEKLRNIGLQVSFDEAFRDSYVAVITNGDVVYEVVSDDKIVYSGDIEVKCTYSVMSSGYYTGADSEIKINGVDYAVGGLGFNIVVCDNEAGLVVDSVRFNVQEPQKSYRTDVCKKLMKYQIYLMGME